ncbi:hypothetical protein FB45DRAFT_30202 [Roridomyces roridus]|uniref:Uncharacterized protein n=1 Tax=Roridomyces roridus TaxID=1738132 RepID=A0AAD7G1U4_9AGAR|nr:hypothetical protein FB45DRAFT_30202 [Roridomyces roridus]
MSASALQGPTPNPDVDSKIRLYAAIGALRNSSLPTNSQIAALLEYIKANSPIDDRKLSGEGRKLIQDIREILSTFSRLVQEKNEGEILQRFVWETRGFDVGTLAPTDGDKDKGKEHLTQAKRDAQQASHHLRTLLNLFLTNGEMRKLITDAGILGRDLLAQGASKAAQSIAPDAEQLRQADEAAPHDHFHAEDPTRQAQETATAVTQEAQATAATAAEEADEDESDDSEEDGDKPQKKSLLGRLKSLHNTHVQPKMQDGRSWLADEYFPPERREQWIWRGKKVIIECQKHSDYQESMRWLLDAIDSWAIRARDASADSSTPATITEDPQLRSAFELLRTLLERIAGKSLDDIFEAVRVLAQDAKQDEALRTWWSEVDGWIRKVLLQVGYVTEPACNTRGRELRDSGRVFYDDKYKGHFDRFADAGAAWFQSMANDPLNQTFAEDWARLTKDLLFDSEGNLQFKKSLWEDVRGVILPQLVTKVGYIPIPRVEYTDDMIDLVVENLTLSGQHLFPNIVEMEAHNYVKFSPYEAKSPQDRSKHEVTFTFARMSAQMQDVAFEFRTKTGPIKMKDSGFADVSLGDKGLTVTATLHTSPDTSSVFTVGQVRVKVNALKFSIRDSKHDLLYKVIKPLATRLIKKQIQKALEDAIRTGFEYVDGQLVSVKERANAAKEGGDGESLKRTITKDDRASASSMARSGSDKGASQFKVLATKRESLLPESGHPEGWANRTEGALEKEKKDQWRSNAFDIKAAGGGVVPVA